MKALAVWLEGAPVAAWVSHSAALSEAAKCGGLVVPCIIAIAYQDRPKPQPATDANGVPLECRCVGLGCDHAGTAQHYLYKPPRPATPTASSSNSGGNPK